jgi:hypothetical protein
MGKIRRGKQSGYNGADQGDVNRTEVDRDAQKKVKRGGRGYTLTTADRAEIGKDDVRR